VLSDNPNDAEAMRWRTASKVQTSIRRLKSCERLVESVETIQLELFVPTAFWRKNKKSRWPPNPNL